MKTSILCYFLSITFLHPLQQNKSKNVGSPKPRNLTLNTFSTSRKKSSVVSCNLCYTLLKMANAFSTLPYYLLHYDLVLLAVYGGPWSQIFSRFTDVENGKGDQKLWKVAISEKKNTHYISTSIIIIITKGHILCNHTIYN